MAPYASAQEGNVSRKAGDLMSLLAHRGSGRRRSSSGVLDAIASTVRGVFRNPQQDLVGKRHRASSAGLAAAGVAVLCLGAGYALGNVFPWQKEASKGGLKVEAPRNGIAPGPIAETEDMRQLSNAFFLASSYRDQAGAASAARALRQAGIGKARVREFPQTGKAPAFGLVVYFDGPREKEEAKKALLSVPAPDASFERFRNAMKDWPLEDLVR